MDIFHLPTYNYCKGFSINAAIAEEWDGVQIIRVQICVCQPPEPNKIIYLQTEKKVKKNTLTD